MKYVRHLILSLIVSASMVMPTSLLAAGVSSSKARIKLPADDSISMPGYLVLQNDSDQEVILIQVRSNAYELAMIHQSVSDAGNTRMLLKAELVLKPKSKLVLSEKDVHLMFAGPKIKLKRGKTVSVNLYFNSGEKLPVEFDLVR